MAEKAEIQMKVSTRIEPREFIQNHTRNDIITIAAVGDNCDVVRKVAVKALMSAFIEGLVQPVCRTAGSSREWRLHLMAMNALLGNDPEVEVAFIRV